MTSWTSMRYADSYRRSMHGSSVRARAALRRSMRRTTVAFESVRSYVQLASGLGEMTKAKAMEAAQGILALPVADEVTRRAVQASALADQLLEAARANRSSLLSLIQGEVETALKKAEVARVADVDAARHALTAVTKEIAELRAMLASTGASAVAGASRSSLGRSVARSGAVTTAPRPPAPAAGTASAPAEPATIATAKRATATRGTNKTASPAKAVAKKTAATKTAGTKAATKRTALPKAATTTADGTSETPVPAATTTPTTTTAKKAST